MSTDEFRGTIGRTIHDSTAYFPPGIRPPAGAPNILIMMLDDVGFSDFGCFGSEIDTPNIDMLAERGLRFSGFHTTAMCSTTRAALLTGRNHHSVGVGCLANFDSGFPGYRGKIAPDAATLGEILRDNGYRNYYCGKWHVTRLHETGPAGPFDGWPLGRGFDRFYGFLDAETDQYSPELVRDNSHVSAPGTYEDGYHLTEDMADQAIEFVASHTVTAPDTPWSLMFMPGACHAPHQAPQELIDKYDPVFAKGWDQTRDDRLARQVELGVVPDGTGLPERNPGVKPWDEHSCDEQRLFTRLQAAYAAMLEHTDTEFGRILDFLEASGQLDNTIVIATSDNGASQEGGPLGYINAMGPYNGVPETLDDKIARIDDIGGPDTHTNFPWGWAMAANTPLRRYKQNTHGGGVRDPFVIAGPGIADAGGVRTQFCHVSDVLPTLLDLTGLDAEAWPPTLEGVSFADAIDDEVAVTAKTAQYFEMFGHRGLWLDGWKAVAFHPQGTAFDDDVWELFDLSTDFNEANDLAQSEPARLAAMVDRWWSEAEANQVLPLDDRFVARFGENAERNMGSRTRFEFWPSVGHIPTDVAPDLRSRSYTIEAEVDIPKGGADGVLIAHGDPTSGYSFYMRDGHLEHDLNIGGSHHVVRSNTPVPSGEHRLGMRMDRKPTPDRPHHGIMSITIDDEPVGQMEINNIFALFVSWSGLDVGLDRGSTVTDYGRDGRFVGPFAFTGTISRVVVELGADQEVDHGSDMLAQTARD